MTNDRIFCLKIKKEEEIVNLKWKLDEQKHEIEGIGVIQRGESVDLLQALRILTSATAPPDSLEKLDNIIHEK